MHPAASRATCARAVLAALVLLAFAPVVFDCSMTSIGIVPLPDLGPGTYAPGHIGGLYPNGSNQRPAGHLAAGLAIASAEILPRDENGDVDLVNGKIVMLSIGMSNATQEFNGGSWAFKPRADLDPSKNPRLVIVDGAQGGIDASEWAQPGFFSWSIIGDRLEAAGVTPAQVQVAWHKHAEANDGVPLGPLPAHVDALATHLTSILNLSIEEFPNLRLAFMSSRARSYSPITEPYAYESGLGVRKVIAAQLAGDPALRYQQPGAVAPWLSWGPYLWADGLTPRSDGFTWDCSDVEPDFNHPAMPGETKVADQLLAFFKTDPLTRGWFLRDTTIGSAPTLSVTPSVASGAAPLTVEFTAEASDSDGIVTQIAWNYDDGLYAYGHAPTKIFPVPGTYDVRTTVSDDDGNTTTVSTSIVVTGGGLPGLVILPAVADTYVSDGASADDNFGAAPDLVVNKGMVGQNAVSLLRFDLSGLDGTISEATLKLHCNLIGGPPTAVTAQSVASDAWTELGVTWNTQPALGVPLATTSVSTSGLSFSFDVTAWAQTQLAGDGLLSVALSELGPDTARVRFDSREGVVTPVLSVQLGAPDPWQDLGFALAGSAGVPRLLGTGTLMGGEPVELTLRVARASAPVALISGITQLAAPFKGGTLVPSPDQILTGLSTSPDGTLVVSVAWPVGLPPGLTHYFQEWITDPVGPLGFAASNALSATTP
ncbi:MAG: CBM96 family carbohydrate-binding protein [Planctomycetota bacterium]|jgi:PKD repeat protein